MNQILKVIEEGEKEFDEEFIDMSHYDCPGNKENLPCATMKKDVKSFQKEQAIKLLEAVNEIVNGHKRTNTYEDDEAIIFKVALEEIYDIFISTINQIKEK